MRAEGVRRLLLCVKNKETHGGVYRAGKIATCLERAGTEHLVRSIAKTVQNHSGGKNERITENQNQA